MKPLLTVPLTSEDWEIRKHLEIMDQRRWLQTMDLIESADRRDAALMLYLMRKPPHIVRLWVAMRTAVNANLLFAGRLT